MSWKKFFRRSTLDRDRADEIEAHVDLATEHYVEQGMAPDAARRKARLRFGNPRAHRERVDDLNRLPILDALRLDLRYAVRMLRRTPAFTIAAVATLAIVIGANTAVLGVVDHVLVRKLPFPDPDRLALVATNRHAPTASDHDTWIDGTMWEAVRDRVTVADRAAFVSGSGGVNFNTGSTAVLVKQQRVGAGFFRVLGVAPLHGREFSADEDVKGGPRIAVLSFPLWRTAFGGDPTIVGRSMTLRGEPYTIVGVMPSGFRGIDDVDVWTPLRASREGEGGGTNYQAVVRLSPGATWEQLAAELRAVSSPELFASMGRVKGQDDQWLSADPMQAALSAGDREPLVMLTAAVGAVLVIACVNIAALLLARGASRRKELATRMALGSGRAAVIRQLMVESLLIAVLGGVSGLLAGAIGLEGLKTLAGDTFTDWKSAAIDGRVIALVAGLSLLTSVLFGLVPAWQASRIDVQRGLADGGSRSIAGGSRHWLRRGLVVAQVALGVVLLVCAGLLIRTFAKLDRLDPGFEINGLRTSSASLQDARYETSARINQLFDESLTRLTATPGVDAAAVSLELPYERILNLGVRFADEEQGRTVNVSYVTPGFVKTLRIPLKAGRDLAPTDRAGATPVVLVNETFARLLSKGRDPIGRRLRVSGVEREIVGVVGDVQQKASIFMDGMTPGPITASPQVFVPASQLSDAFFNLVHQWFRPVWSVRGASPDLAAATRAAIAAVDPALPLASQETMAEVKAASLSVQRLLMTLVALVAGAALLLAAMGLHGLIAHSVTERTREFGIRLALGATASQTIRSVAWSGVTLAIVGAVIGGIASIFAVKLVEAFLWGVEPGDPVTYAGAMSFLIVVAAASSLLPAMRLLRLDPAKTLRD
ncbi:MAG: ABC transporter permease [Acidobacteria bacterium]|nr:MAG: ABC transporter permease [Acidobacteriota bacterium]